jgi:TBC1 domain family member 10
MGPVATNQGIPDGRHMSLGPPRHHALRQVASSGGLRLGGSSQAESSNNAWQESLNAKREGSPPKLNTSQRSASHSNISSPLNNETERDKESNVPSPLSPANGANPSSGSMTRSASLRSKLSISALRAKGSTGRPSREGNDVPVPPLQRSSPEEEERVQVKDMEFELIRPTVQTSGLRVSEDAFSPQVGSPGENESILSGKDGLNPNWRSDSPGFSPGSSHVRSPNVQSPSVDSLSHMRNASAIQAASVEAHRMREQKWMSLISTVSSSQARKNKKVKRLLLEGVPSSVRGRVWGHVTDSRARRMDGLFPQLVKKAPKQMVPRIEQDIERDFPEHHHLRDPKGSLANLLLAYVAMVPDIRYSSGMSSFPYDNDMTDLQG